MILPFTGSLRSQRSTSTARWQTQAQTKCRFPVFALIQHSKIYPFTQCISLWGHLDADQQKENSNETNMRSFHLLPQQMNSLQKTSLIKWYHLDSGTLMQFHHFPRSCPSLLILVNETRGYEGGLSPFACVIKGLLKTFFFLFFNNYCLCVCWTIVEVLKPIQVVL